MFDENQNPTTEEVVENTEQETVEQNLEETSEETKVEEVETTKTEEKKEEEPTFTKEQVDEMIAKKLARKEAKIRKEYDEKYSRLETVVNAGLGTDNTEDAVKKLTDFYEKKGVKIPTVPKYSERDTEILANAEALDIIEDGYDEVVKEVDRLAKIGVDNMTPRDKVVFSKLAEERKRIEDKKDLATIGVTDDILQDTDFQNYAKKLNPNLSLREKWEMYSQVKPKPKVEKMGSMKGNKEKKVKDYYTPEEIASLSLEDLDNEEVWKAVRKSMTMK